MLQPELWSKNKDFTTQANKMSLEKFKKRITWRDDESILEFGIAEGSNSKEVLWPYMPKNFKEFIATDISEVMVESAKRTLLHEKTKFRQLDIATKDIPQEFERRFDHIFSFFVIHWTRDLKRAYTKVSPSAMLQPELWSKNKDFTTEANKLSLAKFKNRINWSNDESILEFGIAEGSNSKEVLWPYIPENFKEFIGTDISKVMVDYLKKSVVHESRMKFMQMDIATRVIPQEFDSRFDHIFSFFVIHWIRDLKQAFSNIYKMLKPGGELFMTFFERSSADEVYDYLSKHPKWSKYGHEKLISPFHFYDNPKQEYEKILWEAGFSDYCFEVENWSYEFPTEQAFEELFLSINPIVQKIPKEDVEEYKKTFIAKMKWNKLNWVDVCENTGKVKCFSSFKLFILLARKPQI